MLAIETDPESEQYHMDPLLLWMSERTCKKHRLGKRRQDMALGQFKRGFKLGNVLDRKNTIEPIQ